MEGSSCTPAVIKAHILAAGTPGEVTGALA
jgi:hypothetical protein